MLFTHPKFFRGFTSFSLSLFSSTISVPPRLNDTFFLFLPSPGRPFLAIQLASTSPPCSFLPPGAFLVVAPLFCVGLEIYFPSPFTVSRPPAAPFPDYFDDRLHYTFLLPCLQIPLPALKASIFTLPSFFRRDFLPSILPFMIFFCMLSTLGTLGSATLAFATNLFYAISPSHYHPFVPRNPHFPFPSPPGDYLSSLLFPSFIRSFPFPIG